MYFSYPSLSQPKDPVSARLALLSFEYPNILANGSWKELAKIRIEDARDIARQVYCGLTVPDIPASSELLERYLATLSDSLSLLQKTPSLSMERKNQSKQLQTEYKELTANSGRITQLELYHRLICWQIRFAPLYPKQDALIEIWIKRWQIPSRPTPANQKKDSRLEQLLNQPQIPGIVPISAYLYGDQDILPNPYRHISLQALTDMGRYFSPEAIRSIGIQLCKTLSDLHSAGIVHGGISLEQIYLSPEHKLLFGNPHLLPSHKKKSSPKTDVSQLIYALLSLNRHFFLPLSSIFGRTLYNTLLAAQSDDPLTRCRTAEDLCQRLEQYPTDYCTSRRWFGFWVYASILFMVLAVSFLIPVTYGIVYSFAEADQWCLACLLFWLDVALIGFIVYCIRICKLLKNYQETLDQALSCALDDRLDEALQLSRSVSPIIPSAHRTYKRMYAKDLLSKSKAHCKQKRPDLAADLLNRGLKHLPNSEPLRSALSELGIEPPAAPKHPRLLAGIAGCMLLIVLTFCVSAFADGRAQLLDDAYQARKNGDFHSLFRHPFLRDNDPEIRTTYEESRTIWIDHCIDMAMNNFSAGYYEEAYEALDSCSEFFPDDPSLLATYEIFHVDHIQLTLAESERYSQQGSYINAFKTLARCEAFYPNDPTLTEKMALLSPLYSMQVMEESAALLRQYRYDEGYSMIDTALTALPNSTLLREYFSRYIQYEPTELRSTTILSDFPADYCTRTGNGIYRFNDSFSESYNEFSLQKKYQLLSFYYEASDEMDIFNSASITVYADSRKVRGTGPVSKDSPKRHLTADIRDADKLTFLIQNDNVDLIFVDGSISMSHVFLWKLDPTTFENSVSS